MSGLGAHRVLVSPVGNRQRQAAVRTLAIAGSARGAVPASRRARFPGPPSEPGVPVSRHRALHEARYQQTVALTLGSAVPGLDCQVGHRYSPAAPALPTRPAASLCPFALWPAFPDLRLLRALRHDPPPTADDAPARRPKAGGRRWVASHVHCHPVDEVGAQLYPGSLARGTPQPFSLASSPATTYRLRSRSPQPRRACTAHRPTSARLEPARRLRSVNAGSSRTPSRLACRTRPVWQCRPVPALSGLLPPSRTSPRSGCPQLRRPAATDRRRGPSIPARSW